MYDSDFGSDIGSAVGTLLRWVFYFLEVWASWNIAGYWATRFWSQFILMVIVFLIIDSIRGVIIRVLYDAMTA